MLHEPFSIYRRCPPTGNRLHRIVNRYDTLHRIPTLVPAAFKRIYSIDSRTTKHTIIMPLAYPWKSSIAHPFGSTPLHKTSSSKVSAKARRNHHIFLLCRCFRRKPTSYRGYFVVAENALKIKKYLDRGLRKAKTDKKDAFSLWLNRKSSLATAVSINMVSQSQVSSFSHTIFRFYFLSLPRLA